MKPDFLNRFMDLNGDGEIDLGEEYLGFKIMNEVFKDEKNEDENEDEY